MRWTVNIIQQKRDVHLNLSRSACGRHWTTLRQFGLSTYVWLIVRPFIRVETLDSVRFSSILDTGEFMSSARPRNVDCILKGAVRCPSVRMSLILWGHSFTLLLFRLICALASLAACTCSRIDAVNYRVIVWYVVCLYLDAALFIWQPHHRRFFIHLLPILIDPWLYKFIRVQRLSNNSWTWSFLICAIKNRSVVWRLRYPFK